MTSKRMWFGTRESPTWIPMPMTGAEFSKTGWGGDEKVYLNGGVQVLNSVSAHKTYNMEWSAGSKRDDIRPVSDYADGIYGDGPIYFVTPEAADRNALPQHWAFPAQSGLDAPILFGGSRPTIVKTIANTLRYPTMSLQYNLAGPSRSVYLPIPPGFVAWFGMHGSANGWGGVKITPFTAGNFAATAVYPEILSVTNPTRFNVSFSSADFAGIEITLGSAAQPGGPGAAATLVLLSGLMAQILPEGVVPAGGEFISGQGHSGCTFVGKPNTTIYQITPTSEAVGMTARLVETEAWR